MIANSKVELCFSCGGQQIRVVGQVEEIDDNKLKDEIVEHPSRNFLKAWKEGGAFEDFYKGIAVFNLKNGVAHIWSMDKNFQPQEIVQL